MGVLHLGLSMDGWICTVVQLPAKQDRPYSSVQWEIEGTNIHSLVLRSECSTSFDLEKKQREEEAEGELSIRVWGRGNLRKKMV